MSRSYAGVLALVAFAVCLARGAAHGASADDTLIRAWTQMLIFAALGYLAGRLAGWMVEETVRDKAAAEVKARAAENAGAN